MDGNPANLRWFYILEDIIETEDDEMMKQKIRKCQDSLQKYPLVIHDPEHCMLLRHFDQGIVRKMKTRLELEESVLKPSDHSSHKENTDSELSGDGEDADIRKLARSLEEEDQKQRKKQEETDHAMAMRLSQEYEERPDESLLFDYVPNPSAAFDINESDPKVSSVKSDESAKEALAGDLSNGGDCEAEMQPSTSSKKSSLSEKEDEDDLVLSQEIHHNDLGNSDEIPDFDDFLDQPKETPEKAKSSRSEQEDEDYAFAMRLSQEINHADLENSDETNDDIFGQPQEIPKKAKSSRSEQEDEDYALALRLSQEMPDVDFDYVPNPSSAFDLNESKPIKIREENKENSIAIGNDDSYEFNPRPSTSGKPTTSSLFKQDPVFSKYNLSSSEAEVTPEEKKPVNVQESKKPTNGKKKTLADAILSQDPIFRRLAASSSDDEDDNQAPPSRKRPKKSPKAQVRKKTKQSDSSEGPSSSTKKKGGRKYYPKPGSGASAILIALLAEESKDDYKGFMTKKELCAAAEPHADESMTITRPGANQYYTGWSSSSTLAKKGYITMWSNPRKVKLTDSGKALAEEIMEKKRQANAHFNGGFDDSASWLKDAVVDTPKKTEAKSDSFQLTSLPSSWNIAPRSSGNVTPFQPSSDMTCGTLLDGSYDIILLVDKMEVVGGSTGGKTSRKMITVDELTSLNVTFETRRLSIGDFVWIARSKIDGTELVLPYIVERKRMDDLRSSIMDGRYKEQKQRIQRTGIPNKYYLVEEIGHYKTVTSRPNDPNPKCLDRSALDQAMSNTLIRDGFHVEVTKNQKQSMRFLARITTVIVTKYAFLSISRLKRAFVTKVNDTNLPFFQDFHENSRPEKPLNVREIFCNMLICQRGLSAGMAWAITSKYPTLRRLKDAYENCTSDTDKEKLLLGIPYDNGSKKIPLSVSKTLCSLFNDTELE